MLQFACLIIGTLITVKSVFRQWESFTDREIWVACTRSPFLQNDINVLIACDGVAASLSGSEVTMLTNAWAELLTQAAIDDERVSKAACMQLRY